MTSKDDSESDTKIPERHVSPTNFTLEIPNAPILPAPSAIVAPPFEFPLPPVVAPPEIRRRQAILFQPEEDIPIGQLYRTHLGGPCKVLTTRKSVKPLPSHRLALRYTSHHLDRFTFGSSSSHSSSDHSLFGNSSSNHSLSKYTSPDTTDADSSTPQRFVHLPLNKTPRCSEAYLSWRSAPLSTIALVPSCADLLSPRKRFRDSISSEDSVEEDIDTDVLEDIEADATTIEVAVDRDVKAGIDVGIGMKVDVMIDVEDEVKVEVESSDRGTMEVGVDMDAGIDIPDEIPLQRIEDIETAQRQLEAEHDYYLLCDGDNGNERNKNGKNGNGENGNAGNGNLNENNRDDMPVNLTVKNNDLAAYTQRFQELTMLCTSMVPKKEDRIERKGHYMSDFPKLKDQNYGNKAGNKNGVGEARGKAYVLGGGHANPDSNVIKGTFLLNNHYDFVLFNSGIDRSFVSSTFSTLLDIIPNNLDVSYVVELANGRISETNIVLRGCTLGLLGHPFNIDLMPVELGSFDVINGIDWLANHHAVIVCDEKIVRIPYDDEVLIVQGDEGRKGEKSKLSIISCTKTQKYTKRGCLIFLAKVTKKETIDKSKEKRLEDVPTVRDFSKVF
nr:reverse transcriptase domain-containing protein [Tanacetum cinerariifolium]